MYSNKKRKAFSLPEIIIIFAIMVLFVPIMIACNIGFDSSEGSREEKKIETSRYMLTQRNETTRQTFFKTERDLELMRRKNIVSNSEHIHYDNILKAIFSDSSIDDNEAINRMVFMRETLRMNNQKEKSDNDDSKNDSGGLSLGDLALIYLITK